MFGSRVAGKQGAYPVAVLDPRICLAEQRDVALQAVEHLCPCPFARVAASAVTRIVHGPAACHAVYLVGFVDGRMVFPQDEHGIRVLGIFGQQCQRRAVLVGQRRCRGCRVERYAAYVAAYIFIALSERFAECRFECLDIVERVLAVSVFGRVAVEPFRPAGVGLHCRSRLAAVVCVHYQATDRVASEIHAYDKVSFRSLHGGVLLVGCIPVPEKFLYGIVCLLKRFNYLCKGK